MKKRILAQLQTPDDALDAWRRYRTIPRDEYGKKQGYAGQGMPCDAPCHPVVNRHCDGNHGPEDAATAGYLPGDFPHPET